MIVADVDFGSFPCTFPTKPSEPELKETTTTTMTTTTMELGPNAEMSLAQAPDEDASMTVVEVSQRLESLDMNPTAEDAYERAVISSSSSVDSAVGALATHVPAPTIVTTDHYKQFLELLYSRFTQTVAPLPKAITKSFNTPLTRATVQEVGEVARTAPGPSSTPSAAPINSSSTSTRSSNSNSKISYVPSSRSYAKPTPPTNPARRRTTSAPSNSSAPTLSLVRKQVTSTFDDLGSMMKVAEGMMDYMRTDMEEEMKRRRRRAREERMDSSDEEDQPLTRKVPVARFSPPWYSASAGPLSHDPSVSSTQHVAPQRKFITPRRLRARLLLSTSGTPPLATIPESTEPGGGPVSNDAIDKCASRFTSLKLDDVTVAPKPIVAVAAIPQTKSITGTVPPALLPSNPIRLYMGYNRDCTTPSVVRSSTFVFGSDMVSTPSAYNPTSYEIVL